VAKGCRISASLLQASALALGVLLCACSGIGPEVREAEREAAAAVARYRAGYQSVGRAYVNDVTTLLDALDAEAGKAEMLKRSEPIIENDGERARKRIMVPIASALKVLELGAKFRAVGRKQVSAIRDKLATNEANYQIYRELSHAVRSVLAALERRRKVEDALVEQSKRAAAEGVKRAKHGGY